MKFLLGNSVTELVDMPETNKFFIGEACTGVKMLRGPLKRPKTGDVR